jgi:hypothetical protein
MTIVGYARVSTGSPALDAQEAALRAAGAEGVFAEKISGAVTDRKALARLWRRWDLGMLCWSPFSAGGVVLRNALCGNSANSQWL